MRPLDHLLRNNRDWADDVRTRDPSFFDRLASQQAPRYFWIGCSDSRVPANTIVKLPPGEVFVHRNVANMVKHADMNCLSAMQFAIDVLRVEHIIVCGHYGCGGVRAVLSRQQLGLVDHWLAQMHGTREKYSAKLDACRDEDARHAMLCELNVIEQVANVCQSPVVQAAWARGQDVAVHGWIYGLTDGHIHDLQVSRQRGEAVHRADSLLQDGWPREDATMLQAYERDIARRATVRTAAPDCVWGQDYGT